MPIKNMIFLDILDIDILYFMKACCLSNVQWGMYAMMLGIHITSSHGLMSVSRRQQNIVAIDLLSSLLSPLSYLPLPSLEPSLSPLSNPLSHLSNLDRIPFS